MAIKGPVRRFKLRDLGSSAEHGLVVGPNPLGRDPVNRILIEHPSVSGFHAEISVLDGGNRVWVRDLGSTNGTLISGRTITEGELRPGEALRLGDVEMTLEVETVEVRIPSTTPAAATATFGVDHVLADGTPACCRNPELAATHQPIEGCQAVLQCPARFHVSSLRATRLTGKHSKALLFCPHCNAKCEPIPGLAVKPKKKGLIRRIADTVRLGFRR